MKIAGMKCVVMFQKTGVSNPTIYHWKNLIESGFPFLKVKTVRDHYPDVDVSDWREVLRSSGYDVSLAERAIAGATDETNHTMAYPKAPDHWGFREISGERWSWTLPLTSIG